MTGNPAISVVVTVYSRRQFLRGAIESVLSQTLDSNQYEVIVLKNFEEDILDSFLIEHGVRVYQDEGNVGRALAKGIRLARGDIVCFLDDDDLFLPEKLNYVRTVFAADPALGYLHNSFIVDDGALETSPPVQHRSHGRRMTFDSMHLPGRRLTPRVLWLGSNLSSVSMRRDWVLELLPVLEQIETATDGFFIVAALSRGIRTAIDPEVLTVYRYHESSTHFLEGGGDGYAIREREHMGKYLRALTVLQSLAEGTPLEASLRYDLIYWRIRYALFDRGTQRRLEPADAALFIRGGIMRRTLHPFYLLPAYLAVRVTPRTIRTLFHKLSTRFGSVSLT